MKIKMTDGFNSLAKIQKDGQRFYSAELKVITNKQEQKIIDNLELIVRDYVADDICVGFRIACENNLIQVVRVFLEQKGVPLAHFPEISVHSNNLEEALNSLTRNVLEYLGEINGR